MREAMDRLGLSSGRVAYRLNVSGATVRGWTTGRRGIGPDELARFARIVACPVEYFMDPNYVLPPSSALVHELRRLSEQAGEVTELSKRVEDLSRLSEEIRKLVERLGGEAIGTVTSDDQAIAYLRDAHNLDPEAVAAIRRIIEGQQ